MKLNKTVNLKVENVSTSSNFASLFLLQLLLKSLMEFTWGSPRVKFLPIFALRYF